MNIRELAGLEIDEYKLISIIGQGGMSAVYRAYQEELERYVAIKILSDDLAQDPSYLKRFQGEAKMAASLESAHIVPVYDFGVQDGLTYVAMRLLHSTLTDKMYASTPMSLNDVLVMLEQIAKALDYAHSKSIVHRDVKPSNIMFDESNTAYLVDFGIAKATQQTDPGLTSEQFVMGTPSYMPPELWRGDVPVGASDQYALAIVVFQILTGKLPFTADSPSSLMYKHLNDTPPVATDLNPNLYPAVAQVLQRAMHKDADQRYPLVANFVNALTQALTVPPTALETQERQVIADEPLASIPTDINISALKEQTVPIQAVPRPPQPKPQSQPPAPAHPSRRMVPPQRRRKPRKQNTVMLQVASGGLIGIAIILILLIIGILVALFLFAP